MATGRAHGNLAVCALGQRTRQTPHRSVGLCMHFHNSWGAGHDCTATCVLVRDTPLLCLTVAAPFTSPCLGCVPPPPPFFFFTCSCGGRGSASRMGTLGCVSLDVSCSPPPPTLTVGHAFHTLTEQASRVLRSVLTHAEGLKQAKAAGRGHQNREEVASMRAARAGATPTTNTHRGVAHSSAAPASPHVRSTQGKPAGSQPHPGTQQDNVFLGSERAGGSGSGGGGGGGGGGGAASSMRNPSLVQVLRRRYLQSLRGPWPETTPHDSGSRAHSAIAVRAWMTRVVVALHALTKDTTRPTVRHVGSWYMKHAQWYTDQVSRLRLAWQKM